MKRSSYSLKCINLSRKHQSVIDKHTFYEFHEGKSVVTRYANAIEYRRVLFSLKAKEPAAVLCDRYACRMAQNNPNQRSLAARLKGRLQRTLGGEVVARHDFAAAAPSPQQTVDIFANQWISAFPNDLGVTAGWINHFDPEVDTRVPWAGTAIPGGFAGKSILELGPFEGYHTASLEWAGAASVTSVEASRTAYLKCLVVKELLGLNAKLLYGDVNAYLASTADRFDIGWASGILYHQVDPIGFLEGIAAHADTLFLHSHFFDSEALPGMAGKDRFRPQLDELRSWHGRDICLHRYEYEHDTSQGTFAGGPNSYANWLELPDIEFILQELGIGTITYGILDRVNPNGPGFFLIATRA
jgi:hypothetical protein